MYEVEDLATLIETAGLGTVGTDIYVYHSPSEAQNCIIVYPSNDPPSVDPETPFYVRGKFQVIVRNRVYQDGITLSKQIADALTLYNTDTTQMTIQRLRPLHQVRVYRRSQSGLIEFSVTYQIIYVQK